MATVGFIGTGTMGCGMAMNLLRGGHSLRVYDRSPERLGKLAEAGALIADSAQGAAADADVVITMLPTSKAVRETVEGPKGIVEVMRPGSLLIDMGTSKPDDVLHLGAVLAERGLKMLDAPVGRPPRDAHAGTLIIVVGGEDEDVKAAWPLFECMGEVITHVGPLGSGITLKIINNYMSMVGMVLTAETLALGRKAGLDREILIKVLSSTAAGRGQLIVNYPNKVLAGDISPDFSMSLGLKDIGLAMDLGSSLSSPLPLGGLAREFFNIAIAKGRSQQDCTAMLLVLEELAGLEPSV